MARESTALARNWRSLDTYNGVNSVRPELTIEEDTWKVKINASHGEATEVWCSGNTTDVRNTVEEPNSNVCRMTVLKKRFFWV